MIKYFNRNDMRQHGLCVATRIVYQDYTRVDINRGYVISRNGDADIILMGAGETVNLTRIL